MLSETARREIWSLREKGLTSSQIARETGHNVYAVETVLLSPPVPESEPQEKDESMSFLERFS